MIIQTPTNQSVEKAIVFSEENLDIKEMSYAEESLIESLELDAGGIASFDLTAGTIKYTPKEFFRGMEEVELYLTSNNNNKMTVKVVFIVGNLGASLSDTEALVYGKEDSTILNFKLLNYKQPKMEEIFKSWTRFNDGDWFPSNTTPIGEAASWELLINPNRISCTVNSVKFTGFVSSIKFPFYTHRAVLSSPGRDDDLIGLVIAAVQDGKNVHTLSAVRTAGGTAPVMGWALVYRVQGEISKRVLYGEKSVDGVFKNPAGAGWSGKRTLVEVKRINNVIRAKTSGWNLDSSKLELTDESEIVLDLKSKPELSIFLGAQFYGYGSHSQRDTTFYDVEFSVGTAERFIYDIEKNLVYVRQESGPYKLVDGEDAFEHIGYPRLVKNSETGIVYYLNDDKTYQIIKAAGE